MKRFSRLRNRLSYIRLGQGIADKARLLAWALISSMPRKLRNMDISLRAQSALIYRTRFKLTPRGRPKRSRIRIGWVADHFYPEYLGGAEITDYLMIKAGEERGYEIVRLGREDVSDESLRDLDFLVVSNVHTFTSREVECILRKRFILYLHDPVIDPHTPILLKNAVLAVFLSPLHKRFFQERLHLPGRVLVCPPPVMIERQPSTEREEFAVYAGLIAKHKGIYNVLDYARKHPSLRIYLVGRSQVPDLNLPGNVEYLGVLEREELLDLLSRAKYFIHLPEWVEAFGRAVAEAYLCGCQLIVNDKVGFLSYPWNFKDREGVKRALASSPQVFWDAVISAISHHFYSEEGRQHYQRAHYLSKDPRIVLRYYLLSRILDGFNCARALDVGCAEGLWCRILSSRAGYVVGIDISEGKLSRASRHPRIDYVQASWDHLPFRPGAFSITTAFEALEHSTSPERLLKSLLELAGEVLASFPICEKPWKSPFLVQGHLYAFDYGSACNLLPKRLKRAWSDSYTFYGLWEAENG